MGRALLVLLLSHPGILWAQRPTESGPGDEEVEGPEVVRVEFEGAHTLDREILEGAIFTEATHCRSPLFFLFCALGMGWALERAYLDPLEVDEDEERLRLLYQRWGFPEVVVSAKIEPKGQDEVEVIFEIEEGEPIRVGTLEVIGLDSLNPPVELEGPPPLEPGDLYALPKLEEFEILLARAFAERGYPYAGIEVDGRVDEESRRVALVLRVNPGPEVIFGFPEIITDDPIKESTVRDRLAFRPGDLFSLSALGETERRLYQLPIVKGVEIEPLGAAPGALEVSPRIEVESGRQRAIQVLGTLSSSECLEVNLLWADRYFLGGPRLFGLGFGFSNLLANSMSGGFPCTSTGSGSYANPNYFVEAEFTRPLGKIGATLFSVRGFHQRESVPQVYIQRRTGGEIGLTREFRPELLGGLTYAPVRNELRSAELYYCGNFGICDEEVIDTLTALHWIAPIEGRISWTPAGSPSLVVPLDARVTGRLPLWRPWGRLRVAGAATPTGSQYDYLRGVSEGAVTRFLGKRWELASRIRLGGVVGESVLPPQTRFYSGGANSVRGVSQNLLGPKILVTRAEQVEALGCRLEPKGCPADLVVDPKLVGERALGGRAVVDLSLEGRVWIADALQLATFIDFGSVWRDPTGGSPGLGAPRSEALLTPGVGVRVLSPFGPVRLDIGYNPIGTQRYPLLVRDPEENELVDLGVVHFNPFTYRGRGGLREFFRRLHFQLAMGQPF